MNSDIVIYGLGTMGLKVATTATESGYKVAGVDPVDAARSRAEANGITTTSDAVEAVQSARTIVLSVPRPEHVRSLVDEVLHHALPDTTVVDLSTIDPETAQYAASSLEGENIAYVDAPVLGRPENCGKWTLVAGGPGGVISAITPLLERTIAARVMRVGNVGAGSVVKILNNLMFGAINAVTAEALILCKHHQVDPALFANAVAESGAATVSNLFKELAPKMISGDDEPTFSMDLLAKDNHLALQLAESSDLNAPVAAMVTKINAAALEQGLGQRDTSSLYKAYANFQTGAGL